MSLAYTRAYIVGAGNDIPAEVPPLTDDTIVICADGGVKHAQSWGLTPSVIIGDMDSIESDTLHLFADDSVKIRRFPVEKDATDVELAVNYAVELGVRHITLVGVWGGRIDHSLGNLEVIFRLALRGVDNEILTSTARLCAFTGDFSANTAVGTTVSLIPLTPVVSEVTTNGLYYSLHNSELVKGITLGISNKSISERISIRCSNGILLVVLGS